MLLRAEHDDDDQSIATQRQVVGVGVTGGVCGLWGWRRVFCG